MKKEREQDKMRKEEIDSQLNMDLEEYQNANIIIENKYLKEPNIEEFTKIKIKEDNNNLLRAILIGLNLEENYCLQLRSVLANLIEENNYNKDILNKLNYESSQQLAKEIRIPNTVISYEALIPLSNKFDLIFKIYLEDSEYKGNKWLEIRNEDKPIDNQEAIFLSCYQGEKPDLEGHYDLLIPKSSTLSTHKASSMIKKLIEEKKYIKKFSNPINIMIWNCDSLSNYTKRAFLIEQLYTNNIQICLLQETMLKKSDKLYMKGFKIYRADNGERRKGVAILISNELKSLNQITEKDDYNGRFIQVKLTSDDDSSESIIFNNIYIEPDQENNKEIIPQTIWQSEHIAGDMNKTNRGFSIDSKVYHIKNMGKRLLNINIPKIISDHPMIIYQMSIPIPFNEQHEIIKIFDKKILSQNNEEIKK